MLKVAPDSVSARFIIRGNPIGKPRMNRGDKWKQRPCVLRYRDWADAARKAAGLRDKLVLTAATTLTFRAYVPMPAMWKAAQREAMRGEPCLGKPDLDNLQKSLSDALFANDEFVYAGDQEKFWDDGSGPRMEVEFW